MKKRLLLYSILLHIYAHGMDSDTLVHKYFMKLLGNPSKMPSEYETMYKSLKGYYPNSSGITKMWILFRDISDYRIVQLSDNTPTPVYLLAELLNQSAILETPKTSAMCDLGTLGKGWVVTLFSTDKDIVAHYQLPALAECARLLDISEPICIHPTFKWFKDLKDASKMAERSGNYFWKTYTTLPTV